MAGHLCPTPECAASHLIGWNDTRGYMPLYSPQYLEPTVTKPYLPDFDYSEDAVDGEPLDDYLARQDRAMNEIPASYVADEDREEWFDEDAYYSE